MIQKKMFKILRDITEIMTESENCLGYCFAEKTIENCKQNDFSGLSWMEGKLNKRRCITVGANRNHVFNIYKNSKYYYLTGGGQFYDDIKRLSPFKSLQAAMDR